VFMGLEGFEPPTF